MSVANDSTNGNSAFKSLPVETRRAKRSRIRERYESGEMSLRELAGLEGESPSTIMKWSMRYGWSQKKRANKLLVQSTVKNVEAQIKERTETLVRDQLQPLIEAEKVKITKRGIKVGNHGISRIQKLWRKNPPTDAKQEADGARAVESFLRTVRVSCGMGDGSAPAGSLNLNILTNRAAVQVVSQP